MEDLLRIISTPDKGGAEGEEGIFDSEDEASEEEEDGKAGDEEGDEDSEADEEQAAAAIDAAVAAARPADAPEDEVIALQTHVSLSSCPRCTSIGADCYMHIEAVQCGVLNTLSLFQASHTSVGSCQNPLGTSFLLRSRRVLFCSVTA